MRMSTRIFEMTRKHQMSRKCCLKAGLRLKVSHCLWRIRRKVFYNVYSLMRNRSYICLLANKKLVFCSACFNFGLDSLMLMLLLLLLPPFELLLLLSILQVSIRIGIKCNWTMSVTFVLDTSLLL